MAQPNGFTVFCPYPPCRGIFLLPYQPRTGQELRCRICSNVFSFQPVHQQRMSEWHRQRRQQLRSSLPCPIGPAPVTRRGLRRFLPTGNPVEQWRGWSIIGVAVVLLVAILAGGIYSVFDGEETDERRPATSTPRATPVPRPATRTPIVRGTPTLREYWDLAACLDLADRVNIAVDAGMTNEQMVVGLAMAEGAVKRYGVNEVLEHCTRVLKNFYD